MAETTITLLNAIADVQRNYETIMQNVVMRSWARKSSLSDSQWREMEYLLDVDARSSSPDREVDLYRLYLAVRSARDFCHALMDEVAPLIRQELARPRAHMDEQNRVAMQLTATNLTENVRALMDGLSEVYVSATRLEAARAERAELVTRYVPELTDPNQWVLIDLSS